MKAYRLNNKNLRKLVLLCADLVLIIIAAVLSLEIRFDFNMGVQYMMYKQVFIENMVIYSIVIIGTLNLFGLYKSLWKYASINELISVGLASFWSNVILYVVFNRMGVQMPRSFYLINIFMIMTTVGGFRFSYRIFIRLKMDSLLKRKNEIRKTNTLIIGAGEAGILTAKELLKNYELSKTLVGFLDDDENKIGEWINGLLVIDKVENVAKVTDEMHIDEIILAMPSISNIRRKEILELCKELGVKLRILPGIYELIDGKVDVKRIRDVDIEDLLGREPIILENPDIEKYIKDKVVMITGGGGSIGSELCRQIARLSPKILIIFDIYENSVYDIQNELVRDYSNKINLKVLIGSVRDKDRLEDVFSQYRPNIVFHAAAHKHVPLMQDSPFEAIKNNTFGTLNVACVAGEYECQRFVLISTDKAVNPTNLMGASKRLAEIAIQSLDHKYKNTEFVSVRFGNVLGSNGSVIPLFKKQIENGGPITVTHPDIIRYFMTIPEAVELVLQAGSMANGGEIFILDMGEPVKILSLAEDLIKLSGFEPNVDIDIEFTGLRPGEKLFEELLMDEEGIKKTGHKKIFIGKPLEEKIVQIDNTLFKIREAVELKDLVRLEKNIKSLVPNYRSKE